MEHVAHMQPWDFDEALDSPLHYAARSAFTLRMWERWALAMLGFVLGSALVPSVGNAAVALAVVLVFLVPFAAGRVRRGLGVRWLASTNVPIDLASYLDALDGTTKSGAVVVEVVLRDGAAVVPCTPGVAGTVESTPGIVRVTSPALATNELGSSVSAWNARPVHLWMRALVDGTLAPLHARHPIERVTVKATV